MASLTIGAMSAQQSDVICSEQVALENLAAYIDTMRTADPHVKLFYTNLVNNPTHSYRIEHHDVGFNGCTGRVDEKVVLADGTKRDNVFIFNEQGLLTQSVIQGSKGNKTTVNYTYSYDDVLGFALKQSKSKNQTIDYAPIYGEHGYRVTIKGSNGSRQDYTFDEQGHLTKRVITPAKGAKRTLLYQGTPRRARNSSSPSRSSRAPTWCTSARLITTSTPTGDTHACASRWTASTR